MWTVVDRDGWRVETYGDDLYGSLVTNIETGDMYVINNLEHVSKSVVFLGFTVYVERKILAIHAGNTRANIKKIDSYEEEIEEMLKCANAEYTSHKEQNDINEKVLPILGNALEHYATGPTKEFMYNDWLVRYYGDTIFVMEKDGIKHINSSLEEVNWGSVTDISIYYRCIVLGGINMTIDTVEDVVRCISYRYTRISKRICEDKNGALKKKIKKLESILESLNGAILM